MRFTTKAGAMAEMLSLGQEMLFDMQLRMKPTEPGKCQFNEWDVRTMTFWDGFEERLKGAHSVNALRREAERFLLDLEEFIEAYESKV